MSRDPYADFTATDDAGAELSLVWIDGGGARIYISGDQPMDQPPCSYLATPSVLMRLMHHIREGLITR